MLGSHPISAILGADIAADSETSSLRAYVKALTDVGLSVLVCEQGTKIPADYRTPKQKEEDLDTYRRELEVPDGTDIGSPRGGIYLATNNEARLRSYVTKFRKDTFAARTAPLTTELKALEKVGKKSGFTAETAARVEEIKTIIDNTPNNAPMNLAVEVGNSNLIVVDCDTAAQVRAFCNWWASKSGDPLVAHALPTVLSPGVCENGVWKHKDGGHYYFTVDGYDLPKIAGKMTVEHEGETFDVFWRNRYVLIPPSVRPEGPYRRVGPVLSLSDHLWLEQEIHRYCAAKKLRPTAAEGMSDAHRSTFLEWYAHTSWSDLLVPHGWEWTGTDTACQCPIWGRPGGRSSDKSATAHEPGCARSEYNPDDPPIHFWTSAPGKEISDMLSSIGAGVTTMSKLQLFAALEHEGDVGSALNTIGIRREITRSVPVPGTHFNTSKLVELDDEEDSYGNDHDGEEQTAQVEAQTPQTGVTDPLTGGGCVQTHTPPAYTPTARDDDASKTLVQPAAFNPPQNSGVAQENLTAPVTTPVTPIVTAPVTPIVTAGVTEIGAPHYDPRYGMPQEQHLANPTEAPQLSGGHQFSSSPVASREAAPSLMPKFSFTENPTHAAGQLQGAAAQASVPLPAHLQQVAAPFPQVMQQMSAPTQQEMHQAANPLPMTAVHATGVPPVVSGETVAEQNPFASLSSYVDARSGAEGLPEAPSFGTAPIVAEAPSLTAAPTVAPPLAPATPTAMTPLDRRKLVSEIAAETAELIKDELVSGITEEVVGALSEALTEALRAVGIGAKS